MKPRLTFALALIAAVAAPLAPAASSVDALAAPTRQILSDHKDSILWVSGVAKVTFSATEAKAGPLNLPDQEQKVEVLGTVIDASGLVVTALSGIDPTREISGREFRTPAGKVKLDATATLKEVRLIMPDGTEVPCDVVMKDFDLDLAFIKARLDSKEAKGVTFKALDLKSSGAAEVADEIVTVCRLDDVLNRQPAVQRGQIIGITQKPRVFLRALGACVGCPTFALDGKLLGIAVVRSGKDKPSVPVILPAADVLEIAEQAKTAKPVKAEESKPATETKAEAKPAESR